MLSCSPFTMIALLLVHLPRLRGYPAHAGIVIRIADRDRATAIRCGRFHAAANLLREMTNATEEGVADNALDRENAREQSNWIDLSLSRLVAVSTDDSNRSKYCIPRILVHRHCGVSSNSR